MFIIYIAHCRGNLLWHYIPARFGLSDAADMFVFLSGMAASIAFGGTFMRQGLLMGSARIVHRCWQLLIAHLGLFFTVAMVAVAGTRWYGDTNYVEVLSLQRFFSGFSLGRGWIAVPLDSKPLLWGSIFALVGGLAISLPVVFTHVMWIDM